VVLTVALVVPSFGSLVAAQEQGNGNYGMEFSESGKNRPEVFIV
jgi:hypothetical protein